MGLYYSDKAPSSGSWENYQGEMQYAKKVRLHSEVSAIMAEKARNDHPRKIIMKESGEILPVRVIETQEEDGDTLNFIFAEKDGEMIDISFETDSPLKGEFFDIYKKFPISYGNIDETHQAAVNLQKRFTDEEVVAALLYRREFWFETAAARKARLASPASIGEKTAGKAERMWV